MADDEFPRSPPNFHQSSPPFRPSTPPPFRLPSPPPFKRQSPPSSFRQRSPPPLRHPSARYETHQRATRHEPRQPHNSQEMPSFSKYHEHKSPPSLFLRLVKCVIILISIFSFIAFVMVLLLLIPRSGKIRAYLKRKLRARKQYSEITAVNADMAMMSWTDSFESDAVRRPFGRSVQEPRGSRGLAARGWESFVGLSVVEMVSEYIGWWEPYGNTDNGAHGRLHCHGEEDPFSDNLEMSRFSS